MSSFPGDNEEIEIYYDDTNMKPFFFFQLP